MRRRKKDMEKCKTLAFANFAFGRLILDRVLQFVEATFMLLEASVLLCATNKNKKILFELVYYITYLKMFYLPYIRVKYIE